MKNLSKIVIGLTLATSMTLTGCSLVKVNPQKDAAQVVAQVNGAAITKGEVYNIYDNQKASYGIDASVEKDPKMEDQIKKFKESILDSLIEQKVIEQKAKEKGLTLTDEEKKTAEQEAKDAIESVRKNYEDQYTEAAKTDKSIDPVKKANEEVQNLLKQQGLTEQSLIEEYQQSIINQKLSDSVTKTVKVTDADIKKYYDQELKTQTTTYAKTPSQFETDENSGKVILFQPAGFIRVKHILIKIPDEEVTKITQLKNDKKTDEAKKEQEKALEAIKPKAQSVLDKVNAKEDFDKLMDEYGEDPGMKSAPYNEKGYLLGKDSSFVPEFKEAALKLSNVGDVTGLVASDYGYHIIKLVEKVPEGIIPLDKVKESLQSDLTQQKKDEAWKSALDQWKKDAKIKKYADRL